MYLFKWVLFLTIQIMFGSPRSDLLSVQCDFAPNAPMEHTHTPNRAIFVCLTVFRECVYVCWWCCDQLNHMPFFFFLKNHNHKHLAKPHPITD